jgi:hypothetical protein
MVSDEKNNPLDAYKDKVDVFSHNIYSHASNEEWIADPYIGFRLKKLKKKINGKIILNTNYLGLRTVDNFISEKFDVMFLGGSLVYGAFSPSNETTISAYFEKLTKLKSLNAGVGGHVLKQHFSLFSNYLKKISSNKIIFVFGFNDMGNCFNGKNYQDIKLDIFHKKINKIINDPIKEGLKISVAAILKIFKLKKIIYNLIKKNSKKTGNFKDNTSNYLDDLLSDISYFKNLSINKEIYFFIQPNLITTKKKLTQYEKGIIESRDIKKIQFCKNFHEKLNKKIKNLNNIINLESIFDNEDDTIFIDEAHVADKGNEIIAKKIYEIIQNG